jgi:hypothetical protein
MQLPRSEVVGAETQRAQLRAMRRTLQQGLMLQKGIWFRVARHLQQHVHGIACVESVTFNVEVF